MRPPKDDDYSWEGWKGWLSSPARIREHMTDYPYLWAAYGVGIGARRPRAPRHGGRLTARVAGTMAVMMGTTLYRARTAAAQFERLMAATGGGSVRRGSKPSPAAHLEAVKEDLAREQAQFPSVQFPGVQGGKQPPGGAA